MDKISEEEKSARVDHFRRIIRYRSIFGWFFAIVGICLSIVGIENIKNPLVFINGLLFFGYGLFMVWQTKKAKDNLDSNNNR